MAALADHERLWRRVSNKNRNPDGSAQSSAFRCENFCVHVVSRTTLEKVSAEYPTDHLYEFTVAQAKSAGAHDVDDSLEPGDAPDHAMVRPKDVVAKKYFAKALMKDAKRVWPAGPGA